MDNIKDEARKIIDEWKSSLSSTEDHLIYVNHETFKKVLGHLIFTDKELVKEINVQGKDFISKNNIKFVDFLSTELKKDRALIIELIKNNGSNLSLVNEEFKNDEEIVWIAIKSDKKIFACASEKLRDNEEIVNFALHSNPKNIRYASDKFKKDKDLVYKILEKDYSIIQHIHNDLKNDVDFMFSVWTMVKEQTPVNDIRFQTKLTSLIYHMGEELKPFFEPIAVNLEIEKGIKQMDSCFNNLVLQKELNQSINKQTKKLKV